MLRKTIVPAIVLAVLALAFAHAQTALASGGWTKVKANLNGAGPASGKAVYRERQHGRVLEQRFSVEVEDAVPGEMMTVAVNGVVFGIIVIDDLGIGELEYRTPAFIDDPGDGDPIPDGFPTLHAGDDITVGPLSGTFVNG